jgi:hypothetical protein
MDQGHVPHPFHDAAHVVGDGDDETGGQLAPGKAGVHQGGGVGQKLEVSHGFVKSLGLADGTFFPAVARLRGRHRLGHPPEKFLRGFDDLPLRVAPEIALLQDPPHDGPKFHD